MTWDSAAVCPGSGAAAHPAGQLVTGNAVLVTELLKLLQLHMFGKNPQRLVSGLWVANVTQGLYYPLPAILDIRTAIPVLTRRPCRNLAVDASLTCVKLPRRRARTHFYRRVRRCIQRRAKDRDRR